MPQTGLPTRLRWERRLRVASPLQQTRPSHRAEIAATPKGRPLSRQRPAELRAVSRPPKAAQLGNPATLRQPQTLLQRCCALAKEEGRPSPQAVDRDERPWPWCQAGVSRGFRPQALRQPCHSRPVRNPCTPASALTRRTWGLHFCGQSNRCKRCAHNAYSGACDAGKQWM